MGVTEKLEPKVDTFPSLYSFSTDELNRFFQAIKSIPTTSAREHLVRFNLTGNGVQDLATEGQNHLVHQMDAVPEIKGGLYLSEEDGKRKRFTVFWPGELASHLQIFTALRKVFPEIAPLEKYAFQLDKKTPAGVRTYSHSAFMKINDWLTDDSRPH
jgi:hypothetical protein